LEFEGEREYENPFLVQFDCVFNSPQGEKRELPGFYDGDGRWKVRFTPFRRGRWSYETKLPFSDPGLEGSGEFEVVEAEEKGGRFLRTCPEKNWGLEYEGGERAFILGDTMYNVFGAAHCGLPYRDLLRRRKRDGFNLIRARVPVSPFHPPKGYSEWQNRSTWPWQGSPQKPVFTRFNLDYFHTVDQVMAFAAELDLGFEVIMEAWGFEFPFNKRDTFTPEYEQLWMRYLIARYDAFSSTYVWTLMNEYEYYPNGDWHYTEEGDHWALRVGRWVKELGAHDHPVAVHNGPRTPPFAERFRYDPEAIDLIMFQDWGTRGEDDAWLANGIGEAIEESLDGWEGSAIFAEYGYERNEDLELKLPIHEYLGPEHTRRGAWRGAFSGLGVIGGFENTWGPWWIPKEDQEGLRYLKILGKFFGEEVDFEQFSPASALPLSAAEGSWEEEDRPLALSDEADREFLLYLPTGQSFTLDVEEPEEISWFDPRHGEWKEGERDGDSFGPPVSNKAKPDWVLQLKLKEPYFFDPEERSDED